MGCLIIFIFFNLFFNWSQIALKCVGFCHTTTLISHNYICVCSVAQLCLTLCNPMDCNLPSSSVHEILQARILERVAMLSSRGSSQPMDQTHISCTVGISFTTEPPEKTQFYICIPPLFGASFPSPTPTPLGQDGLPVFYCNLPLASYFTHGSIYMFKLLSQFNPPSLSPAASTSPFSTFVSSFLLCK